MGKWFQWIVLTSITGSPLLSIGLLLVVWWVLDRFTLGIFPDPVRWFMRWRRVGALRQTLANNPHDRKARFELADLYLEQRRHRAAAEVLKANLEAGDDDPATLYLMGVACYGAGFPDQGEVFLGEAREQEAGFRLGAIDLELGRGRLRRGDAAGAREALERFCALRHATVEGKVLLGLALEGLGEKQKAAEQRASAWADFTAAPRFLRRRERFWAWRARPSRPIAYAAIGLAAGLLFARFGAPVLRDAAQPYADPAEYVDPGEEHDPVGRGGPFE